MQKQTDSELQRQRSIIQVRKCQDMIAESKKNRNETKLFINGLGSRYRIYIYSFSGLHHENNNLKFEQLTSNDRRKVINGLRELRDWIKTVPTVLPDKDININ